MQNPGKGIAAAAIGFSCLFAVRAGGADFDAGQDLDASQALLEAQTAAASSMPGSVAGSAPSSSRPLEWVSVKTSFDMTKTLVTVEQYAECHDGGKGPCTEPGAGDACNWGKADRRRDPINCVSWAQARAYADFKGAALPTESEYEYAATSGGKRRKYPWGDDAATCDRAVMFGNGGFGCGGNGTMPVCSKPAGNAEVPGGELCDMVGDVWEWMQGGSHADGPAAGGDAVESIRVIRGGSFYSKDVGDLRAGTRYDDVLGSGRSYVGFRLVRATRRAE
jgi:formylglycine-generating enzyme required for sulfatase activity